MFFKVVVVISIVLTGGLALGHDVDTDSNVNLNNAVNQTNYGTIVENFDSNYTNFTTNSSIVPYAFWPELIRAIYNELCVYDLESTCAWFGCALFCNGKCPSGYDEIREHSGRCDGSCVNPPGFGHSCWSENYKKRFCCRANTEDCSLNGRWYSSDLYAAYKCQHYPQALTANGTDQCGDLNCVRTHGELNDNWWAKVSGYGCNVIERVDDGIRGNAVCGQIVWTNSSNGRRGDSWYKMKN